MSSRPLFIGDCAGDPALFSHPRLLLSAAQLPVPPDLLTLTPDPGSRSHGMPFCQPRTMAMRWSLLLS